MKIDIEGYKFRILKKGDKFGQYSLNTFSGERSGLEITTDQKTVLSVVILGEFLSGGTAARNSIPAEIYEQAKIKLYDAE